MTQDVLRTNHMPDIREFNRLLRGTQEDDLSDDEAYERFIELNRFFMGGNTVSTARNLSVINSLSEEDRVKVGRGFDLFNQLPNIFSEENTWAQTAEGVGDYAKAVLADPINLVSFGIGKAFAAGGARAGTEVARRMAMEAYRRALARGATEEVAQKAAAQVSQRMMERAAAQELASSTAQQAVNQGAVTANRLAMRGVAATVTFDTVVAVGTDQAYQAGLIRTGAQEDLSWAQTGLAALGVLAVGGAAMASAAMRGSSGLTNFDPGPVVKPSTQTVSAALQSTVTSMGDWAKKVANGRESTDLDTDFWTFFLLGNDELGLRGVKQGFVEQGLYWQRRAGNDNVLNWITDVLKTTPSDPDAIKFLQDFQAATGVKLPELSRRAYNDLIDDMATKANGSARYLNAAGQLAKALKIQPNQVTPSMVAQATLANTVPAQRKTWAGRLLSGEQTGKALTDGFRRFQNNTIRMIVTNPATTALNVQGWAAASTLNSLSDIARSVLHGGKAGLELALGRGNFDESLKVAKSGFAANFQKLKNTLDPNTTHEVFRSYAVQRADSLRELLEVGAGGIDIQNQVGRGPMDPTISKLGFKVEQGIDRLQRANLVQAQDAFTKSQEFLYQLDRRVREKYGKSLVEFMKDPNRRQIMNTQDYVKLETEATNATLRSIFSKSYKGQDTLGEVAGVIEDLRNIPVIGLLVPFGRFFNNTIAFMSDATGLSVAGKFFGYNTDQTYGQLMTKAAVSYGLVLSLVDRETEFLESGLGTFQEVNPVTGDIVDKKFEFPYSLYKAAARIVAYTQQGQEIPPEEAASMQEAVTAYRQTNQTLQSGGEIPMGVLTETFEAIGGQLFRQLFGAGEGIAQFIEETVSGDKEVAEILTSAATAPIGSVASGWTRFLEPYNTILALARDTDWQVMDRKQGSELINNSLRYMDQMVDLMGGFEERPHQRYSAAGGAARVDAGKFVGARSGMNMTYTERVMNYMGLPHWELNNRSILPEGDNRFNKLFNTIVEREAQKLWENENFQRDSGFRETEWKRIRERAREQVRNLMQSSIQRSGDRELSFILRMSTDHGEAKVQQGLRELGMEDMELGDLNFQQLNLLDNHLKVREQIIMRRSR